MRYSINIENAKEESGKILFDRLYHLTNSCIKISEGALQIKLLGASKKRGRKSIDYSDALQIRLVGIKDKSTALLVECDKFSDTLKNYQIDAFQNDFFEHTPISVLMSCYKTVLEDENDADVFVDKQLITEMKKFSEVFSKEGERIIFMNEGTVEDLVLTKSDVTKIKEIEEHIPEDQKILISGIVEELKYSQVRVKVQTDDGIVNAYLSNDFDKQSIANKWGKYVTLAGVMHYGLKGTKNFEILRMFDSDDNENLFFKELPKQFVLIDKPTNNPLKKWKGSLKGFDDIQEILKELD